MGTTGSIRSSCVSARYGCIGSPIPSRLSAGWPSSSTSTPRRCGTGSARPRPTAGERDDRPTTAMFEENRRLVAGERGAAPGQRGVAGGQRIFRGRDRPDPEAVMSFVDAHDFSVDLVLRVLGIPAVDLLRLAGPADQPVAAAREDAELLAHHRRDPRRARVRRHLRLTAGVAGAAPPRRAGGPQTRRADHARQRPPGRLPAQGLEAAVDQAEPAPHRGAGPARPRLHRRPRRTASGSPT